MDIVRICSIDKKCCIFFIITLCMLPSSFSKQYRPDYVYNSKTDAFYKFHMETAYYSYAHTLCDKEGASLMVPRSEEDLIQAHGLFKQYPDIGDLAWIENDGNKHESAEEIPLINLDYLHSTVEGDRSHSSHECDVFKRDGEVLRANCVQALPFICKVDAKDAFHDKQCNVFAKGYKYFENVGSCYKIPTKVCAWNEAYAICRGEGAHLIILNSELERQVVYNFTWNEEPGNMAHTYWFFFAGIRAEKTTDGSPILFKTIFNQTLEELGYSPWGPSEPKHANGNEYCVTVFKGDGSYNDYNCATQLAYICENEVVNTST